LGQFILATNDPDLPAEEVLSNYKTQAHSVERGFRFLKDPLFFADSLFLKTPSRIMALIMVMGLALLMYSLAEHWIRQSLKEKKETIPNQLMKPTATPTFRRIAQIFEGIDLLRIITSDGTILTKVLNIREIPQKIIALLGPEVEKYYSSV